LLRYSISGGKEIVSLEDELRQVDNYVILMKIRYEDGLSYECRVPEEIKNVRILKQILQPLVENAITHGIRKNKGRGQIKIIGRVEGDRLVVEIEDNGIGIPMEKVVRINEELALGYEGADTGEKIGLNNVNKRIKLYFGMQYGIKVFSTYGKGTRICLTLPFGKEEEPYDQGYAG
jgi:two-component system sensor histidine kinase YesM